MGSVPASSLFMPLTVVPKTLYQELYLSRQVSDPAALEAVSERVVSDEGTPEAEAATAAAPESSERRRAEAA